MGAISASAQVTSSGAGQLIKPIQTEIKTIKATTNEEVKNARETMKAENDLLKNSFKTEKDLVLKQLLPGQSISDTIKILQERRDAFQKQLEENETTLKTLIETKRADAEKAIAAKQQEMKTILSKFKDEKKKQAVEKVGDNLNTVSKNAVNRFTNNINELNKAVVNITTRAEKAKVAGKDITNVTIALQTAQAAIDDARSAIIVQSAKVYTVTVTSELKVADDLKKSRDALDADLKIVQDKVKAAHDAVWSALAELQKIPEVNKTPTVSATGTTSVTQ